MREWLLRLLGAPRPVVIEFDHVVVDAAQPGSLIILRTSRPLTGDKRRLTQEFFAGFKEKNPDLRFLLLDGEWDICVAHEGGASTSLKGGRQ